MHFHFKDTQVKKKGWKIFCASGTKRAAVAIFVSDKIRLSTAVTTKNIIIQ